MTNSAGTTRVIIVWCESPSGLVSTRIGFDHRILQFTEDQLPEIEILTDPSEVFDILKRQDGTKIAIPTTHVSDILGWELEHSNGDTPQSVASSGSCA